jgi:hypothetical protein
LTFASQTQHNITQEIVNTEEEEEEEEELKRSESGEDSIRDWK